MWDTDGRSVQYEAQRRRNAISSSEFAVVVVIDVCTKCGGVCLVGNFAGGRSW